MDAGEVRMRMLAQFGIRIEPAMSEYVVRQLETISPPAGASFPVMGGDARTGVPVRRFIPAAAFHLPPANLPPVNSSPVNSSPVNSSPADLIL